MKEMKKMDKKSKYLFKAASLAGVVLAGVGNILSNWAAEKEKEDLIKTEVIKAMKNHHK